MAADAAAGQSDRERANTAYAEAGRLADEGRIGAAQETLERALVELPEAGVVRGYLRVAAAEFARLRSSWDVALEHLREAEAGLGTAAYLAPLRCTVHGVRGQIHVDWGLFDLAGHHLALERECVEALDESELARFGLDGRAERANAYLHAVNLALAREEYDEVERVVTEALDAPGLYDAAPGDRTQLVLRRLQGRYERDGHSTAAAREGADVLRELLLATELKWTQWLKTLLWLVEFEIRTGAIESAAAHLEQAVAQVRERTTRGAETELDAPDRASLASLRAALALARGDGPDILAARLAELEAAFERYLSFWARTTPRRGGFGFLQFRFQRQLLSDLIHLSLLVHGEQEGARRGLDFLLRARAMGSIVRRRQAGPGSLAEIRERLIGTDEGVLAYLPAVGRSHLFAVDDRELHHFELPRLFAIEPLRAELVRRVSRPPSGDATARARRDERLVRAARDLAAALLPAELAPLLERWSQVTITGTDLFGALPLECLPLASGESLGHGKAVAYLPSLPAGLLLCASERSDPPTGVLLLAAPEHEPWVGERWSHLTPIPFDADDERALLAPYPEEERRAWIGPAASRTALLEADLSATAVLQVIAHGVYVEEEERPVVLVLAGPDAERALFTCRDADALRAPAVVVLAACGTARGPIRRGDAGAGDLGGAFLESGADVVLLSPFTLDHHATLRLTASFHERLCAGDTPAEALRVARRELSRDERWADPYYTDLLHVVGLGQRPVFPRPEPAQSAHGSSRVPAIAGAVAAAVAAITATVVARRRRRAAREAAA